MQPQVSRIVVFVLALAMQVGLGVYVTARALAPRRTASAAARRRLLGVTLVAVLLTFVTELGARRWAPFGGGAWRPLVAVVRVSGFTLLACMLGILVVQTGSQLGALVARVRRRRPPEPEPEVPTVEPVFTRREAVAQALSAGVTGVATTAAAWGALRGRFDLQVREITLTVPDLPPALEGLTLVQLTDLHIGIFTGPRELARLIARANALRGDVVVLTGDLFDNNPAHIPEGVRALAGLRGRLGVHAVLGNHDHYTGPAAVRAGIARAGITCLDNAAVRLHDGAPSRDGLLLAGVDDVYGTTTGGGPDLPRALRTRRRDEPVVLLAHNPVFFEEASGLVSLQLSGHTHGGQINVGDVASRALPYVAGEYARNGSTLFVSKGVGVTGPPVRLAAAPEIVRIALTGRRT